MRMKIYMCGERDILACFCNFSFAMQRAKSYFSPERVFFSGL